MIFKGHMYFFPIRNSPVFSLTDVINNLFNILFPSQQVYLHLYPSYEGKSLYQGRKVTLPPSYEEKPRYRGFSSLISINSIRLGNKTTYYHIFGII